MDATSNMNGRTSRTSSPPTSRKRSHDGTILIPSQYGANNIDGDSLLPTLSSSTPSPGIALDCSRQASPAVSTTSSSLTDLTDLAGDDSKASLSAVPAKKRKMTFAEREVERAVRKQEKEAQDRKKAEDNARREEEKLLKDEAKRIREEEKEAFRRERELEKAEKQKVKDAERLAKEDEKRKKEEEKKKKERSQMRIGTFFGKPKGPSTNPTCSPGNVSSRVSSRRSSVASLEDTDMRDAPSPSPLTTGANPEYEKIFPPFFIHPHTELAPTTRLPCRKGDPSFPTAMSKSTFIDPLSNTMPDRPQSIHETFKFRRRRKRSFMGPKSVRSIVDQIQGSSTAPVDLTGDNDPLPLEYLLDGVSVKVLSFHEDVRPGYCGTYTRPVSPSSKLSLCRRPSACILPDTDYNYDSEAEWEPPDEGDDDVDAVDDESGSEEEEEDMEDFLDDENDVGKRRLIVGNMDPVCSGLCWQGEAKGTLTISGSCNMKELEMEMISDDHSMPIDPYSTKYWIHNKPVAPPSARPQVSFISANLMQPPRLPLHASNQTNVLLNPNSVITPAQSPSRGGAENGVSPQKSLSGEQAARPPQKAVRLISDDLLPAFRQAVSGSDLNKVGLVEILKKQFPKVSKDVIRDTLSTIAVRQGAKEADKRWVLIDPS